MLESRTDDDWRMNEWILTKKTIISHSPFLVSAAAAGRPLSASAALKLKPETPTNSTADFNRIQQTTNSRRERRTKKERDSLGHHFSAAVTFFPIFLIFAVVVVPFNCCHVCWLYFFFFHRAFFVADHFCVNLGKYIYVHIIFVFAADLHSGK